MQKQFQEDIDAFVYWITDNLKMKLNDDKTKVIHLGKNNPSCTYTINGQLITQTSDHRDLGVIISQDLKFRKHTKVITSEALKTIGMVRRSFGMVTSRQFLKIYKTYIRPKLDYANSITCPFTEQDVQLIERVQRKALKLIKWTFSEKHLIDDMEYVNRLRFLGLTTLETRRARGDMIEVYKLFHGHYDVDVSTIFTLKTETRTRQNHSLVIYKELVKSKTVKRSFRHRVVDLWNSLNEDIVNAPSLNVFKNRLDAKFCEMLMK